MAFNIKDYLESVSLDCVIFGFHNNQLKVLLLKMKYTHEWALPGGFVKLNETVEEAAARILRERTGLYKGNSCPRLFFGRSNLEKP